MPDKDPHNNKKSVVHKVPYYSQLSRHEWKERGFKNVEEAIHWENKSCGMACLRMVFDMHEEYKGMEFAGLVREMQEKGVYKEGVGCVHQGIADELNARGIDAQRMKIEDAHVFKSLVDQENILIVSVGAGFEGDKKNGHLVPVIGYVEEDGLISALIVNHTSSWESRQWPSKEIEIGRFMEHFSGNAIRVRLYPS